MCRITGSSLAAAIATAYGRRSSYDADHAPTSFGAMLRRVHTRAADILNALPPSAITGAVVYNTVEGLLDGPWTYETHPSNDTRALWDGIAATVRGDA